MRQSIADKAARLGRRQGLREDHSLGGARGRLRPRRANPEEPHADRKPRRDAPGSDDARPKRDGGELPGFEERGVGTGVVIVDNGTILTNLHVVLGAERVRVTFMDGLEADAKLLSA